MVKNDCCLLADKRSRFFNIEKHGSAFLYFFCFFFQVGAFIVRQ